MLSGLLFSCAYRCRVDRNTVKSFNESSTEAWGKLTPHRNPRVQHDVHLRYKALVDVPVLAGASVESERTGQVRARVKCLHDGRLCFVCSFTHSAVAHSKLH